MRVRLLCVRRFEEVDDSARNGGGRCLCLRRNGGVSSYHCAYADGQGDNPRDPSLY